MTYRNEVSMGNRTDVAQPLQNTTNDVPEYGYCAALGFILRPPPPSFFFSIKSCILTCFIINISVMVVCNYKLTETLALMFSTVPQARGLHAAPGLGELHVRMRLARGRLLYTLDVFTFYSFEPYGAKQYFSASLYCSY